MPVGKFHWVVSFLGFFLKKHPSFGAKRVRLIDVTSAHLHRLTTSVVGPVEPGVGAVFREPPPSGETLIRRVGLLVSALRKGLV